MSSPEVALDPQLSGGRRTATAAAITGLGTGLGSAVVDNDEICRLTGVTASWIERRTGVHERRMAAPGETTQVLCARAGAAALADAGITADALDLVLVGTMSPDRATPQVAPQVAHDLGATGAAAFDVGAACTAWLSALWTAGALLETGRATTALVLGADRIRAIVDPADKGTSTLFADGAGAAVLQAGGDGPRLGPAVLHADGSGSELIACSFGEHLTMAGHDTFVRAVAEMCASAAEVCARAGIGVDEVDLVVPHQANARITAAVAERLGVPLERVVDDIGLVGNTSAGTLPIALTHARRDGRIPEHGRILLAAFGAGLTWGAALLENGDPA
jgi:3-oxoacyl-[acyl-carrier-protein] synthase-3